MLAILSSSEIFMLCLSIVIFVIAAMIIAKILRKKVEISGTVIQKNPGSNDEFNRIRMRTEKGEKDVIVHHSLYEKLRTNDQVVLSKKNYEPMYYNVDVQIR